MIDLYHIGLNAFNEHLGTQLQSWKEYCSVVSTVYQWSVFSVIGAAYCRRKLASSLRLYLSSTSLSNQRVRISGLWALGTETWDTMRRDCCSIYYESFLCLHIWFQDCQETSLTSTTRSLYKSPRAAPHYSFFSSHNGVESEVVMLRCFLSTRSCTTALRCVVGMILLFCAPPSVASLWDVLGNFYLDDE